MFDDSNFDEFLQKAGRENKDLFMQYGPDFSKIEEEALIACTIGRKKRRKTILLRVAAACVAAVILLNGLLLFMEIEPVKAYQEQVRKLVFNILSDKSSDDVESVYYKESQEMDKVQKLVPFKIPTPGWVPKGYSFADVQMRDFGNHQYQVSMKYTSPDDTLLVNIENDSAIVNTTPSDGEDGYELMKINGNDVYLITLATNQGYRSKCHYLNKQGLYIYLSAAVDKQSLISIVESMSEN